jgi:hypothetical protein
MDVIWVLEQRDDKDPIWRVTSVYRTEHGAKARLNNLLAAGSHDASHPQWKIGKWAVNP